MKGSALLSEKSFGKALWVLKSGGSISKNLKTHATNSEQKNDYCSAGP